MYPSPVQLRSPASPLAAGAGGLPANRGSSSSRLAPLLAQMAPTTLAQLDAVSLLDRVDTKFLLTVSQVASVLPTLAQEYEVLDVEGRRLHQYRTMYFDTPAFELYRHHHAGRAARHKVRSRAYVDTGLSFLEIKSRPDKRRTVKYRLATSSFLTELSDEARAFASGHLPATASALRPALRNDFLRITLVGKRVAERLTMDVNIQFDCEGRTAVLPGVAIAELKQSQMDSDSPFFEALRAIDVQPTSISKYCVGVGLLVAGVEHDAFEDKLRMIDRLIRSQPARPVAAVVDVLASQA